MELRDYLRILRAHWLGTVLIVVGVLVATGAYTYTQPKIYAADASGFVSTGATDNPALASVNDQLAKSRVVSYVDIAKSRATAQEVISTLGLTADPAGLVGNIAVTQPVDTVLLKISARADSPEAAQQLADAWVTALATQVAKIEDPLGKQADGTPRVVPIESAELPKTPVSPQPVRNYALGLAAGLLLALAYALTRNTLDRRLRSPETVEDRFGISVVGMVPAARSLGAKSRQGPLLLQGDGVAKADVPAAEAFRKLRTNLLFMDIDNPPRVIVVSSPRPGDGKSTVAANLAAAVAKGGQPVVLVDADLRRPSLAATLGLVEGVGLTDVLVGRIDIADALQDVAAMPNLKVLAAGQVPPNPSELLGSKTMRSTVEHLAESALVILDTPPLLPVTDAAVLTANSDGALVVITSGRTLDKELGLALDHLEAVRGKALGVIVNRTPKRGAGADYYATYYGDYLSAAAKSGASSAGEIGSTDYSGKRRGKRRA